MFKGSRLNKGKRFTGFTAVSGFSSSVSRVEQTRLGGQRAPGPRLWGEAAEVAPGSEVIHREPGKHQPFADRTFYTTGPESVGPGLSVLCHATLPGDTRAGVLPCRSEGLPLTLSPSLRCQTAPLTAVLYTRVKPTSPHYQNGGNVREQRGDGAMSSVPRPPCEAGPRARQHPCIRFPGLPTSLAHFTLNGQSERAHVSPEMRRRGPAG